MSYLSRRLRRTAALLATAVLVAGCSTDETAGDDPADSTSPATRSSQPSTTPTPAAPTSADPSGTATTEPPTTPADPATSATPSGPTANCLFTLAQVSDTLGGAWTREPSTGQPCAYRSDRGAVVATSAVDSPVEAGLADARAACLPDIDPVDLSDGAFVCVERRSGSPDLVVGNAVARGRLWVAVISVPAGTDASPQLKAMVSLVGAL